jgi:hypothetical protein
MYVNVGTEAFVERTCGCPQLTRGRLIQARLDQAAIDHCVSNYALTVDRFGLRSLS